MHVCPYSRRPGTPADKLPDQLARAVKERRAHEAQAVCLKTRRAYLASCVGQTLPVLFESEDDGRCTGHSDSYMPVSVPGSGLRGRLRDVVIESVEGDGLRGILVEVP